jgi:hypothetical protein
MMKFSVAVAGIGLLSVVLSACAQQPDAKSYQEQEKRWQSCPDGYYSGPRPGRLNYDNDKYLWVVTPEFAKRFCMPEHLADPELKGADKSNNLPAPTSKPTRTAPASTSCPKASSSSAAATGVCRCW